MHKSQLSSLKIAIIIPNYNHGEYISKCIESVLTQDVEPDELIIVDDCSIDNSIEIISKAIKSCSYAKLIQNEKNLGVYGAINVGADIIKSDYVLFLASNDFLLPGIIGHAKKSLTKFNGVGLWSATGEMIGEDGNFIKAIPLAIPSLKEKYFNPLQSSLLAYKLGNWFAGPSVIYHKKTWESFGKFNPKFKGFADLLCALMVASEKGAVFVPKPYVGFRLHQGSYLSSTYANSFNTLKVLQDIQINAPLICPKLFTDEFTKLTLKRLIFSSLRANPNINIDIFDPFLTQSEFKAMNFIKKIISSKFTTANLVGFFIILRSRDILTSLYRRFFLLYIMTRYNYFINYCRINF